MPELQSVCADGLAEEVGEQIKNQLKEMYLGQSWKKQITLVSRSHWLVVSNHISMG